MNMYSKWEDVDNYFVEKLIPHDDVLDSVLRANAEAGLPAIDVSPTQGKLLHLLAKIQGAKKILEIGTLGGYSTIWLARALPKDGSLISLEYNPKHAKVAQTNLERAGLSDKVQILTGPALDSLPKLQSMGYDAFDFIFIDADKPNNPNYLKWALQLSRVGTVIVGDNVVRDGEVVNQNSQNPSVIGTRQFFDLLANEPRIEATAIQTVGNKGYDGFAIGVVVGN
ncbi:O-methyltransferase [Bacillus litorisediminis]|uniref:O-methyltransferase n=1 Tax=Bacillus litorisediminis TaxID=2922713 RepID=UPI001FB031B9|nr:O-methyltransferase [Bacillus litorisediminis]